MPMQLNHFSKLDLLLLKLLVFRVFSLNLKEFRVSVFCTLVLYFLISFIVQFSWIFIPQACDANGVGVPISLISLAHFAI